MFDSVIAADQFIIIVEVFGQNLVSQHRQAS
jgi:hypothetical protein